MNILIIEDEKLAARRLESLVLSIDSSYEIIGKLDSVQASVNWFEVNELPDLVFMDIQLADGLSFEIFDHIQVEAPIIFTTAYDEFALKAFQVNSIDYLLKPIDTEDLQRAFEKLNRFKAPPKDEMFQQINKAVAMLTNKYKNRFVIKVGEHLKSIPVNEMLYFYSVQKATYCCTTEGKKYLLDYSLTQLADMLDPEAFFQISRQYIVSLTAMTDIVTYSSSRLKLKLRYGNDKEEVLVSRDRVSVFKSWLGDA